MFLFFNTEISITLIENLKISVTSSDLLACCFMTWNLASESFALVNAPELETQTDRQLCLQLAEATNKVTKLTCKVFGIFLVTKGSLLASKNVMC